MIKILMIEIKNKVILIIYYSKYRITADNIKQFIKIMKNELTIITVVICYLNISLNILNKVYSNK